MPGLDGGGHLVLAVGDAADVAVHEPGGPHRAVGADGDIVGAGASGVEALEDGAALPVDLEDLVAAMLATHSVSPCTVMPLIDSGAVWSSSGSGAGAVVVVVGSVLVVAWDPSPDPASDPSPSEHPPPGAPAPLPGQPQFASSGRRYGAGRPWRRT